ncbi:ISH4-type transposase ISHwa6 [Halococcus salifodinae DSM 8989]|uniref:ISH4-type transposase ISHwa6 n=1 Tax=Halococcus salifodinae DSM 8989 TaxID=1227456 RepID=M0MS88_9EURY|nr:ISH4-type transposase ISHwa6 [Halococcus salifodinae DSM 8989]
MGDATYDHTCIVHGDAEYADGDNDFDTCESRGLLLLLWISPHQGVSKDEVTAYVSMFQSRQRIYRK